MRDLANKMAELKFEAPLAQFEDSDEWSAPVDYQNAINNINNNNPIGVLKSGATTTSHMDKGAADNEMALLGDIVKEADQEKDVLKILSGGGVAAPGSKSVDNFTEMNSGSLEDLVNTFDEKITKCFGNYEQSVEQLAPVQMRSQEEIMSECQ